MGKPEFTNITQISANPSKKITIVDAGFSDVIDTLGEKSITIFAPTGYLCSVKNISLKYPQVAGSASGTIEVYVDAAGGQIGGMYGAFSWDKILQYRYCRFETGYTTAFPEDASSQLNVLNNLTFDSTNGLQITFKNLTDVSDAGSAKTVLLWLEEEKIT